MEGIEFIQCIKCIIHEEGRKKVSISGKFIYLYILCILCFTFILTNISIAAEPELDPPLAHWLYQQSHEEQTRLVKITVQVQDELDQPVTKAKIIAYCLPWHFACYVTTDDDGQAVIQGPIGDWTFYVGKASYLTAKHNVQITDDIDIVIYPENKTILSIENISDNQVVGELLLGHANVDFQLDDILSPFTNPNPVFYIGRFKDGLLEFSSLPNIEGWLCITRNATDDELGLALISPYNTSNPHQVDFSTLGLATVKVRFDGYGQEIRTVIGFTRLDQTSGPHYVAYYPPPTGGEANILVTPGNYRVHVTAIPGNGIAYEPAILNIEPNETYQLRCGNTFKANALVLTWSSKRLDLWFDIRDNYDQFAWQVPSNDTSVRLTQDGALIYEGPAHEARDRHLPLELDWQPYWQNGSPIDYEYSISNSVLGTLNATGSFPADPLMALSEDNIPLTYRSEHFDIHLLDTSEERGQYIAESMESALEWLFTTYAGPVAPRGRDRWPLCSYAPVGVGWSGGSKFAVNVYAGGILEPYLPAGDTFVLFHELGHCYQASPPHHQAQGFGSLTCESNASLISGYCMRAIQGINSFYAMQQKYANSFFARLLDPSTAREINADDYDFIYHYIHNRYGQQVHRDFQRMLYRSEGNGEQLLLAADFLNTEAERSAAIYSYLCNDNLAWLYRWIGEDVTDEVVNQALDYFFDEGIELPEN